MCKENSIKTVVHFTKSLAYCYILKFLWGAYYYMLSQILKIASCDVTLKCICNENFDIGFFTFSENLVFSDHKNTNLVEEFEPEVC